MRCNEHDGFGRVRRTQFEYLRHFFLQRLGNGSVRWVAEKGHWATAVRDRDYGRETCHVGAVGRDGELLDPVERVE